MAQSKVSPEALRSLAKYLRVPKGSPLTDVENAISILWESVTIIECTNDGSESSTLDENSAFQLTYLVNTCFDVNLPVDTVLRDDFSVKDCCKEVVKHWSGLVRSSTDGEDRNPASDINDNDSACSKKENEVPMEGSNLSNKSDKSASEDTRTLSSANRRSLTSLFSSHGFVGGDDGYSADHSSGNKMVSTIEREHSDVDSISLMDLQRGLPMAGQSEDDDSRYLPEGVGMNGQPLFNPIRNFQREAQFTPGRSEDDDSRYLPEGMSVNSSTKMLTKPAFIPSTLPSLFDSAMSVSTAPSMDDKGHFAEDKSPTEGTREGPEGDYSDALGGNNDHYNGKTSGQVAPDPITSTSSAFHNTNNSNEPPTDYPDPRMTVGNDPDVYIMDLERINEESSGQDLGSLSRTDQTSVSTTQKGLNHATAITSVQSSHDPTKHVESPRSPRTQERKAEQPSARSPNPAAEKSLPQSKHPNQQYQHSTEFYNYRHQYYTEQYHYIDDRFSHATQNNDGTDSTCSSVTLSQAFHPVARGDESCDTSYTEDSYADTRRTPSYISNVSSVTLSQALSVERHEHEDQGFYVATRLGDFVAAPPGANPTEDAAKEIVNNEEDEKEVANEADSGTFPLTNPSNDTENSSNISPNGNSSENTTIVELTADTDGASTASVAGSTPANEKDPSNQITKAKADSEVDIIAAIVPECGAVVPTVVNAATQRSMGMLLPWHSTRSIDYYRHGGRGGRRRKGASGSRSIFSHSSVHTFRG